MLKSEIQFFFDNQTQLLRKYSGKFIVIKDKQVIAVYNSRIVAYAETLKKHEMGSFLIQHCLPEEDNYLKTSNDGLYLQQ